MLGPNMKVLNLTKFSVSLHQVGIVTFHCLYTTLRDSLDSNQRPSATLENPCTARLPPPVCYIKAWYTKKVTTSRLKLSDGSN